uniref:Protein phosphatase, Mg2+/Mn2+ dependent 1F n=1 Tax=Rousettus aegyptiacus TaxID=9407 RepID=A0A7J8H4C1_ROUAE|nr:protein phosphatase, Mg2+/Mn2+ dependent 1F [Rousettus aegyptiacus]
MAFRASQQSSQMAEETPSFLDALLRDFPAPLNPESPLPWKVPGTVLSQEEVEGELIELAMGFLSSRNALPPLASSLAHEAVSQLLQTDLSEFRKLPRQEVEDNEEEEEKTPVTLLDAKGLARRFFNQLWEVCSQWQKQVPLAARAPQRQWLVSIHAIRNTRRKMEDRHVCLPTFNQLFGLSDPVDRAYFAVFDGHGGVDAARYAAVHVHANAAHQPELPTDPAGALKEAFRRTDEMFLWKAKRERLQSGSTGVCALIAGKTLHIAWLGDSQVILVQQGQVVKLMEPHKPERQDEKERIEALGGFVSHMDCWRVNGTLAVSRAIASQASVWGSAAAPPLQVLRNCSLPAGASVPPASVCPCQTCCLPYSPSPCGLCFPVSGHTRVWRPGAQAPSQGERSSRWFCVRDEVV